MTGRARIKAGQRVQEKTTEQAQFAPLLTVDSISWYKETEKLPYQSSLTSAILQYRLRGYKIHIMLGHTH